MNIFFVMFPIYSETRKRDVVTDNYLYPFFDLQRGDGLRGWQFWPLFGARHKVVTTVTNGFGDAEIVSGYDKYFALWPIHFWQNNGIGTDDPEKFRADLPLYSCTRSAKCDSTTVLWPFFNWIDEREKKYREWQAPWPLVIFARGEGKTTSRVFPLFSQSHNQTLENDSYLWPLYCHKEVHSDPLEQTHDSVLFYIYSAVTEKNTQTGAEKKRLDMWPFFTWHRDFNGNERLQIFAPVEPAVPEQPRRRAQLVAALVVVAGGAQSQNRRRQPVAALESLPPRHDAGLETMLAPVRPFPVSIGAGGKNHKGVFHSRFQNQIRARKMKKEERRMKKPPSASWLAIFMLLHSAFEKLCLRTSEKWSCCFGGRCWRCRSCGGSGRRSSSSFLKSAMRAC